MYVCPSGYQAFFFYINFSWYAAKYALPNLLRQTTTSSYQQNIVIFLSIAKLAFFRVLVNEVS